jgi:hypothetical protein
MPDTQGLSPAFAAALNKLVAASGGRVWINSGYRSPERQAQLFAAAVQKYGSEAAARKWVAPPGRSRHNMGQAADLGGDMNLAASLAPQFGLYRPMSWEDWHFEPVGSRSGTPTDSAAPSSFASQFATPTSSAQPSPLTREFAAPAPQQTPAQPMPDGRAEFASGLVGAIHGGTIDPRELLQLVLARRAAMQQ